MFELQLWQFAVVAPVALLCVGGMALNVVRMLSHPAAGTALVRPSTGVETGLVGDVPRAGERAFDAFSYRTTARYAGRVRVIVRDASITVAGPRAPRALYVSWIWLQAITLALVPPLLLLAIVMLEWRWLLVGLGVMVVSSVVMAIGAGVWPGLGETMWVAENRFDATEIPLEHVRKVTLGTQWARDGLRLVIAPYAPGIDKLAANRAVCFNAPDGEGRDASWGLHMLSDQEARELYDLLTAAPPT